MWFSDNVNTPLSLVVWLVNTISPICSIYILPNIILCTFVVHLLYEILSLKYFNFIYKFPNGYTSIHLGDIFVLISVYISNSKSDDSANPADIGGWCETYSLINLNYLS